MKHESFLHFTLFPQLNMPPVSNVQYDTPITNPMYSFRFTKESVLALRITICLANLSSLGFLLLLVVFHKLKSPSTLMLMVF